MKKKMKRLKQKLRTRCGFSLGELLAATLILLLASQVLAEGIAFGARTYRESLTRSHGKQLCSTLTAAIETELRYTTGITYDENNGNLLTYFSPTYGQTESSFLTIDENDQISDQGEIAIKVTDQNQKQYVQRLISGASYSSFELKAMVEKAEYNRDLNRFEVVLSVWDQEGQKLETSIFDVVPVNEVRETI